MSQVIKPEVSRHVWFYQKTPDVFPGSDQKRAAIVAHVHSDRMVNLLVIDSNGNTHGRTSVPLVQPGDEVPLTMHCTWMDYTVEQAKKLQAA